MSTEAPCDGAEAANRGSYAAAEGASGAEAGFAFEGVPFLLDAYERFDSENKRAERQLIIVGKYAWYTRTLTEAMVAGAAALSAVSPLDAPSACRALQSARLRQAHDARVP